MQRLVFYSRPTHMLWSGLLVISIFAVGAILSSVLTEREYRASLLVDAYVRVLDRVQIATLQMETGQRGYLLTGNQAYLDSYDLGRHGIKAVLDQFSQFDPVAMGLSVPKLPIGILVADKMAELEQTVALRRGGNGPSALQIVENGGGRDVMTKLHDELGELRAQSGSLVDHQQKRTRLEAYRTIVLIVAGLLLSGSLEAISVSLLRREIAARRGVEAELREGHAALARSNGELEQFAYIASHDLQEPLRMITSYIQLLRKRYAGKLDSNADEFIGYVVDGAKRMKLLINDLLAFSRVGTAAKPVEPVDVEAALGDTLKDLKLRIKERDAVVTHEPLPSVCGDPVQIRQVLLNLIGNGMKFQPVERKPTINITALRDGSDWRFGVHDNGIGIDSKYFKNLFQIFKRLHTKDEYPGTGIGLAVCKKIVERHGGRIWVESVLGQGSTFFFTLPAMDTRS